MGDADKMKEDTQAMKRVTVNQNEPENPHKAQHQRN
jgi:hypothetical protein